MTAQIIEFPSKRTLPNLTERDQQRLVQLVDVIDEICAAALDEQYLELCCEVVRDLTVITPFPFARGRIEILAGAVVHLVGRRNGLFHSWFGPRLAAKDIADMCGASMPSINNHSKRYRELLKLGDREIDPRYVRWTMPVHAASAAMLDEGTDQLDVVIEPEEFDSMLAALPHRAAMLDELADMVTAIATLDSEASDGATLELASSIRHEACAMRRQATLERVSPDALALVTDNAAKVAGAGQAVLSRHAARTVLGDDTVEQIGDSCIALVDIGATLTTGELALAERNVDDEQMRACHRAMVGALADGYTWAQRTNLPPRPGDRQLVAESLVEFLDAVMALPGSDLVSPGAPTPIDATIRALEDLSIELEQAFNSAVRASLSTAREQARQTWTAPRLLPTTIGDAFEIGAMLCVAERLLDEHAAAIGMPQVRSANPIEWLGVLIPATNAPGAIDAGPSREIGRDDWLQLRIQLLDIEPAIVRVVRVPASMTLDRLHDVLQDALGWLDCHLHEFHLPDGRRVGMADGDWPEDDMRPLDERSMKLTEAFAHGAPVIYQYDFGDDWEHLITVEDAGPKTADDTRPWLVAAARACPPEDCGGSGGYELMLEALADPDHEEHDSYLDWTDGGYDPDIVHASLFSRPLGKRRRGTHQH